TAACPPDLVLTPSTVCRAADGTCDVAESCDGMKKQCPPDKFQPNGTSCDDLNACTSPDACKNGVCKGPAVSCANAAVTSAAFTILYATRGDGGFDLYINDTLVEATSRIAPCSCNEEPQVVTIQDPTTLALITGCNDTFEVRESMPDGRVGLCFARVDVTYQGAGEPTSILIYDAIEGWSFAPRDLCDGY